MGKEIVKEENFDKKDMKKETSQEQNFDKKDLNVSKVILKTSVITALIFVLVILVSFCITALVSPKLVSQAAYKMGAKRISAKFAVGQYERSKDINDLGVAVERSISAKDYKNTVKYAKILVEFKSNSGREVFNEFAEYKNNILNKYYVDNGIKMQSDYYNYIYGNYVFSLYKTKDKQGAYDLAVSKVTKATDYTENNMITRYIDAFIADKKRSDTNLNYLLEEMYKDLDAHDEHENSCGVNICLDLVRIYTVLQDDEKAEAWKLESYKYTQMP